MIARVAFAVIAAAVWVSPGWAIASEEPLDTWLSDRIASYREKHPSPEIAGEVRSDLATARTRLESEGMSTGIAEALTSPPELSLRRMSPRQAVEILDATRRRIDRFRERLSTTSPAGLEDARGRL
jgi:hypothetical protein